MLTSRLNADDGWIFCQTHTLGTDGSIEQSWIHRMRPDGSQASQLVQTGFQLLLADQGWIYYLNQGDKLWRMNYDGSSQTQVLDAQIYELNLEGDSLYYTLESQGLTVSRLDGSGVAPALDFPAGNVQIAGGWIYTHGSSGRPYKFRQNVSGYEKAYTLTMVSPDPPGTPVVQGLGIENANRNGGALFTSDGTWLYQSESSFDGAILRRRPDGSEQSVLLDQGGEELNRVGDWLYFMDRNAYDSLARIRTDGTGYCVIHDASVSELIVRDNWIYFTSDRFARSLWKVKTDGTERTRLSQGNAARIFLEGDWIYWSDGENSSAESTETEGIHRTRTDGSQEQTLKTGPITTLTVGCGAIFYGEDSAQSGTIQVSRMNLDGSGVQSILTGTRIRCCGVYQNRLYYQVGANYQALRRVNLDGSGSMNILPQGSYTSFHFLNGRILFYDNAFQNYRTMALDGTDPQTFQQ